MGKTATIKNNKNFITFQLSSKYSKLYYPTRKGCKYIYTGLHDDTDEGGENRLKAEIKLRELIKDLETGKFDPYNESKYKCKEVNAANQAIQKLTLPTIKEIIILERDTKFKRGEIHESTYKLSCIKYKKILNELTIDIMDFKLFEKIIEAYPTTPSFKTEILQSIITSIKWAINQEKLPNYVEPILKKIVKLKENYALIVKKNKPCKKNKLGNIDSEFASFSEEERDKIIEAFYNRNARMKKVHNQQGNLAELVEFIFCTGVRLQEAFALTWNDISYDKNGDIIISINKAYSSVIKKVKSTKTGKNRRFYVTDRVKRLIERMKLNTTFDKTSLVFQTKSGGFSISKLGMYWYASNQTKSGLSSGIVYQLYEEAKISKYLNPYQMRASFITHQLQKGVPPTQVAKWTGHDVDTLLKHYDKLTGMESRPVD